MQDWLGLDNSCRMNKPSTIGTNWRWRVTNDQLSDTLRDKILEMTCCFGRRNWEAYHLMNRQEEKSYETV